MASFKDGGAIQKDGVDGGAIQKTSTTTTTTFQKWKKTEPRRFHYTRR